MFTPINSSDILHRASDAHVEEEIVHSKQDGTTTVASAYLGRREIPKKPTSKLKRRTSTKDGPSKAKRRQTSKVKDSLTIHKAGIQNELNNIEYEKLTPATFEAAASKSSKEQNTACQPASTVSPVSISVYEHTSTAAKPIAVYSSKTTMNALDTTSVRTSVEAAKARDGRGFTLYQGPSSTASYSSSMATTKPLNANENQLQASSILSRISNARSARLKKNADVQTRPYEKGGTSASFEDHLVIDDTEEILSSIDMIELAESNGIATQFKPNLPPARGRKKNTRDVDELEDYGGALLSNVDKQALDKINTGDGRTFKPIVRKPFPPPILDRSPIFEVSQGVILRTCFRIGEAIMSGCQRFRSGGDVVIELYARVATSWREPAPGRKQHFKFKDIYHDNPPYLEGTFELWQQAQLWDLDSKVFLVASEGDGIMCRVIARMKRDGQKWQLDMLSVWEATWSDVEFAAGIYTDTVGQ